ncbi:hypothetical protein G3567_06420 [Psychroflexus sp. YR1-1]|uniref:LexA-binding, inner membrane-associated hydrolase n=1 Tax=Psychroflexus aurantiacus TaxID=2709310 RepID=A0A6B3R0Q3_9FLAO|nr:DUF6122 family protein [Psychroflexus aurantiacus]NEV93782.1 hypothetical protein [Psychroflexus aurantiacus]
MWQTLVHYTNHFIVILFIAWVYSPRHFWKAYLILLSTMLVDLDHLWAVPIFDPDRCSIGFHAFHSEIAILIYVVSLFILKNKWLKLFCIGLIFHMITDGLDCLWSGI